jgi:hypothetical protein
MFEPNWKRINGENITNYGKLHAFDKKRKIREKMNARVTKVLCNKYISVHYMDGLQNSFWEKNIKERKQNNRMFGDW